MEFTTEDLEEAMYSAYVFSLCYKFGYREWWYCTPVWSWSLPLMFSSHQNLICNMAVELCNILFKYLSRLNAVREICNRCPLVMSEDLLRDLTQYKNYKERSVMMAARSLIHLYRASMPELLHKKDRVCIYVICDLGAPQAKCQFSCLSDGFYSC